MFLEQFMPDEKQRQRLRALPFVPELHGEMCSELKILYTAITRCRWTLYVVDEKADAPMLQLWEHLGVLRRSKDLDNMRSVLSSHSAASDWKKQADKYFADQRW